MNRAIYGGPMRPEGSRIDHDFLIVTKTASIKDRILLSPIFKYVVPVIAVVVILVTAVYLTLYFVLKNDPDAWFATCNIKSSYRVECFPGRTNITYASCRDMGCCWNDETELCFHSVPARHGYTQRNTDSYRENEVLVPRRTLSPAGSKNAESLALELKNINANHVEIVLKIGQTIDRKRRVNRVKRSVPRRSKLGAEAKTDDLLHITPDNLGRKTVNIQDDPKAKMNVHVGMPEFSVTVTRKDESASPLLSTARGPLILTETYWELTLYVTNSSLYGLNQLELNGTTNWIYDNGNGSVTPSFLGIDDDGRATACYVNHYGPMEIQVLDGSNLIVVRGVSLPNEISLHVFAGPTPIEAVSQLTKAQRNNSHSENIPASSLGLHVCPNDNGTDFIGPLSKVLEIMNASEAPWDSHCLHQGFNPTLGNPLSATQIRNIVEAKGLLKGERSLAPHLSPMLFTATGNPLALKLENSSLLLRDSSDIYVGSYRNEKVLYPDWLNPKTRDEALDNLTDYLRNFESSSIVYLRDSWPRDDETEGHPVPDGRNFDYMPPGLRKPMTTGTVPYNLRSSSSADYHYARHNKYAREFSDFARVSNWTSLTIRSLQGEGGDSSWTALRAAISVGAGSCLVGQLPPPMYVCGTGESFDAGDKKDELCSRWYGSAVMWPHVLALPENLPGSEYLTKSASSYAVKHLTLRASLVTYARTTLARYYIEGAPILAPTSVHYPKDLRARRRWNQYFWGDSILVGLVTLPRVTQVLMWLPGEHPWRHLKGGLDLHPSNTNDTSVTAVRGQIIMLIRPGFVIPVHEEIEMTAEATTKSDLTLVANWACSVYCAASGKIFYGTNSNDDVFLNISISQKYSNIEFNNVLKVKERACDNDTTSSAKQSTVIKNVEILGVRVYNVSIDLCKLTEDSPKINLKSDELKENYNTE